MNINLNINKDSLLKELACNLDAEEVNKFILELIRIKFYSTTDSYYQYDAEELVKQITNKYLDC